MTATGRAGRLGTAPAAGTLGEAIELVAGWEVASSPPGAIDDPARIGELEWLPAVVPGTAAAALRAAGRWAPGDGFDFDRCDWWFRVEFEAAPAEEAERLMLVLEGIATIARVFLNGQPVLDSDSMFAAHEVEVTSAIRARNEVVVHCAALGPLLDVPRRPRARWRTRLVSERNLRFFRTMLLGRAPGFAPGPAAVGPWRPVRLERRRGPELDQLKLRSHYDAGTGRASVHAVVDQLPRNVALERAELCLSGLTGAHSGSLAVEASPGGLLISGELTVPGAEPWWPHTHGAPALYDATLVLELAGEHLRFPAGRIGFRTVTADGDLETDGLQLRINGVPVFARGAVWVPPDPALPASSLQRCRPVLEAAVRAGMNMVRVPGTACYESEAFYAACDELGILVWQDFMFANLDYPDRDEGFMAEVEREARTFLHRAGGHACLAVLCGGSEVAQQAAMMGLDPALAGGPLYEQLLPDAIVAAEVQAPYVPSTPWGGDLPFRPDRGVANYYGVGAYRRPLEDARRAAVKFAAECLAFSNVPDPEALEEIGSVVHHPRWKAGVPRDVGAGWDFEDVRDHYLRDLFAVDPPALRAVDPERYLELSRQVTGEVMAEVLGEWRRPASPCAGALVLWLKDLVPGAGWGLLDHRGEPKAAYHHVRRALVPVAVWSTDEGLGGIVAHVANDLAEPVPAILRVAMYRDLEVLVEEVETDLVLEPRAVWSENVEALLGRFVDASWAYRFGPPAMDLIVLTLERRQPDGGRTAVSQAFRLPAGRPRRREVGEQLGLTAALAESGPAGGARLIVSTRRFAYGVRIELPGYRPDDDAFSVEPSRPRVVQLHRTGQPAGATGHLRALNLAGRVVVEGGSE